LVGGRAHRWRDKVQKDLRERGGDIEEKQ
jgi:hypothetical protein